ncbi:hypothetical protein EV702DRAFT_1044791 [Suillus placidus]|uniref:Uncharacterized protein n=1 Tax=Suillus placidus TaxID=48579 RepID=A0A9P7D3G5_9AGAM|nr:hypothetical protein EV702DRAFT_1044791 [Suillus placidus]
MALKHKRKANSEANQGLRSAFQSHKTQMVSKSKSARPPDYQFTAGEIIFIPCGTKQYSSAMSISDIRPSIDSFASQDSLFPPNCTEQHFDMVICAMQVVHVHFHRVQEDLEPLQKMTGSLCCQHLTDARSQYALTLFDMFIIYIYIHRADSPTVSDTTTTTTPPVTPLVTRSKTTQTRATEQKKINRQSKGKGKSSVSDYVHIQHPSPIQKEEDIHVDIDSPEVISTGGTALAPA